jgi:acyl transferase domain-containing protein/thioesterase domain-containing protein/acyl carrier protein
MTEFAETDIAIVGMAGRFPGAADVDELWMRVARGDDCLVDFDVSELIAAGVPADVASSPSYVRRNGILDDVEGFDHEFFGIGQRDGAVMDPQHRHFLECAWEALESSGNVPERFAGAIGVFGGCGMNTYLINNLLTNPSVLRQLGWFLMRHTGNDKDFLVNNVSYRLDLRGPAINVQTACSTSLVAVHLAVQSLLAFECDLALAGGATIEAPHRQGYEYHEGEILAPDGRCRAFDAASAGTVLTSGVGVVALRRLSDAVEAGDPVLAVVKASAINNDGARKVGFLAPSVDGHADVVKEALTVAELSARDIQLVEAHGTGTAVGDPIEIAALTEAFRAWTDDNRFCRITSTKPNIGHLDTAAGVASLIKVVQALRHTTLPPLANHTGANPLIDFDSSPFVISGEATEWPDTAIRRAGISSLGVGGTNAHVVVEEAPALEVLPRSAPEQVLALSARTPEALDAATVRLAAHLAGHPDLDLGDVAHTLATGRRTMEHRRVVTATDVDGAIAAMRAGDRHRNATGRASESPVRLGFMFPGGGSQYPAMGAGLDERFAVFHQTRGEGAEVVRRLGGPDLEPLWSVGGSADELRKPTASLPAVFVTSVALARQWIELGARPDVLVGHSLGEYVAAHLAGVLSFDDAVSLVVTRSRLMERASGDDAAMLAVPLAEQDVLDVLPSSLSLATINASDECVVAGRRDAVAGFAATLDERGTSGTLIPLSAAAHSAILDPVLPEFAEAVRAITLDAPQVAYPSNLTGTWITEAQATDPQYWVDHLRGTVRFADCVRTAIGDAPPVLVELGPGQALSSYARRSDPRPAAVIPSLRHPDHEIDDTAFTLQAFARQWAAGVDVDLAPLAGDRHRRLRLPTYPFQHERCWIEPGALRYGEEVSPATSSDGGPSRIDNLDDACWTLPWSPAGAPRPTAVAGRWAVLADDGDMLGAEIVAELTSRDADVAAVASADDLAATQDLAGVVVVAPDGASADFDTSARRWLADATRAAATLGAAADDVKLVAVTRAALPADGDATRPADAMALGAVLVAPREYPNLTSRLVDIDDGGASIVALVDDIVGDGAQVVAHRGGERFTPSLIRSTVPAPDDDAATFREGGTYLVTGGLGAVGHALATHLARDHRANLVIVASNGVPEADERASWLATHAYDDPTSRRIRRLSSLVEHGTKVAVVVADVADPVSLRAALDEAERTVGPIDGAIHAAGVLHDGLIELTGFDDHAAVLGAKARGALTLADELARRGSHLLVLVSSTSTVLAPEGQVSYVAANAVLDALAGHRDALRIATINFGLWADQGVASDAARRARLGIPDGERVVHPVFDEIRRDGRATTLVGRVHPTHHWVVDEHRVGDDGVAVYPGTGHLHLMLTAAELAGHSSIQLADVRLLEPLVVAEGSPTTVRAVVTNDPLTVRIESDGGTGQSWTVHSEGTLEPLVAEPPRVDPIDPLDSLPLELEVLDGQRLHLRLGSRWSSIVEARRNDTTGAATLQLHAAAAGELEAWSPHPALLDVATAVGVALAPAAIDTPLYVPAGYDTVRVHGPVPASVTVSAVARLRDDRLDVDLTAVDDDGSVVFEITGLDLRKVASDALAAITVPVAAEPASGAAASLIDLADLHGLRPDEGSDLVERLLASEHDRMVGSTLSIEDLLARRDAEPEPADTATTDVGAGATLETALAAVWSDLLGVDAVGADDDFFDLGGHSLIAIRLMSRIHNDFGVRLTLSTIFEAPTVAELAACLREESPSIDERFAEASATSAAQADAAAPSSPGTQATSAAAESSEMTRHLVPISRAGEGRPLYIVHGAGGNVVFLWSLARAMSGARPIYGFQAHGIEGSDLPDPTVEEMAARYVAELREHAPGPYLLGGFSGGGLVTVEMVRQLQDLGEQVDVVVLFDSPSTGSMGVGKWARRRNVARHLVSNGLGPVKPYLKTAAPPWVKRLLRRQEQVLEEERQERALGYVDTGSLGFVNLFYYFSAAAERYTTGRYAVDAILLKANKVWPAQSDDYDWGRHLDGELTIRRVPGDHHSMFYPENAPKLASVLRPLLAAYDDPADPAD